MDDERIIEIEQVSAVDERRLVDVLAVQDPSWGSMVFDLADGVAVLAGPGLFVNQGLATGLTQPLEANDVDHLEEHAAEVGVPASFELCELTRPDAVELLRSRGYRPDGERVVVVHDLESPPAPDPSYVIEPVDEGSIGEWLTASAAGWGHASAETRAANDAYGAAARLADDPGLLLARAADDGRVVGCAALRITGGVATLGGMSTPPEERGRGVQSALVGWRLRHAAASGCRYAISMAAPGSDSLRNLGRLGFTPSHRKVRWTKV